MSSMSALAPEMTARTGSGPALVPCGHDAHQPPFRLDRTVTLVGSRHRAHIRLESDEVSRSHAVVVKLGGLVMIRDLASRTSVFVNGRQVVEAQLHDGDYVSIGRFGLRFSAGAAGGPSRPTDTPPEYGGGATLYGLRPEGVPLDRPICVLGSRRGVDVLIEGRAVSFAHAVIVRHAGGHFVQDLGSRTGTCVDGISANSPVELREGSVLQIGGRDLRLVAAKPATVLHRPLDDEEPPDSPVSETADANVEAAAWARRTNDPGNGDAAYATTAPGMRGGIDDGGADLNGVPTAPAHVTIPAIASEPTPAREWNFGRPLPRREQSPPPAHWGGLAAAVAAAEMAHPHYPAAGDSRATTAGGRTRWLKWATAAAVIAAAVCVAFATGARSALLRFLP